MWGGENWPLCKSYLCKALRHLPPLPPLCKTLRLLSPSYKILKETQLHVGLHITQSYSPLLLSTCMLSLILLQPKKKEDHWQNILAAGTRVLPLTIHLFLLLFHPLTIHLFLLLSHPPTNYSTGGNKVGKDSDIHVTYLQQQQRYMYTC